MIKLASPQSNTVPKWETAKFAVDEFESQKQILVSTQSKKQSTKGVEKTQEGETTCICLKLEDLKCFEIVERQYEKWGVIFNNCIAIQPSNPAFPPHSGKIVFMGSPKSGLLEATFLHPVNCVRAFITSSQRLVLSAYDRDHQLLDQTLLPAGNLANSDSSMPPNVLLSIKANNIHSVSFCAFDGQFTVDEFSFCF
ncbi:MAG: hypothetical protein QNJ47_15520 [Nostocaceae cyanobacterium]|nr:hypothetical protein [Nostocaceae cyanobacterium]